MAILSAIPRVAVESTSLASVGHCADKRVLVVEFQNGSIYEYRDVSPEAYAELLRAESKGAHFNRFIRAHFSHERISPRAAPDP